MIVRKVSRKDKKDFVTLAKERDDFIGKKRMKNFWREKFDELLKYDRLLLAYVNSKLAGFLYFSQPFSQNSAYVELVYVAKSYRRTGVAASLFEKLEGLLKEKGCSLLISSTEKTNAPSVSMHKSLGFVRCGVIKGLDGEGSEELFFSKQI